MEDQREDSSPSQERQERWKQIRQWYAEAKAMGVSDDDFYREMTSVVGQEELDEALDSE